ncbi:hypothetical protein DK389_17305 [Methylobacterium durans]|uniref:Restriction endonuclease domain-containing protein n=1 Tax=Methylobacterium durans TaxID=2202825 RepID=A0A2U8W8G6_9HYPH|nr:hypothetical protein DK389_17305 [Methylobacterium durans]
MSLDEFLAWSADRPRRYELIGGEMHAKFPQRARHARTRFRVQIALSDALSALGLPRRRLSLDVPRSRLDPCLHGCDSAPTLPDRLRRMPA